MGLISSVHHEGNHFVGVAFAEKKHQPEQDKKNSSLNAKRPVGFTGNSEKNLQANWSAESILKLDVECNY